MLDKQLVVECAEELAHYLSQSGQVLWLTVEADGRIGCCNETFLELIGEQADCSGQPLERFLSPESRASFQEIASHQRGSINLSFARRASGIKRCACHHFVLAGGRRLLLGTPLRLDNDYIVGEMTVLTNQMANMARELKRKNREIEEAQSQIKVLSGLIPICMHCRKIRNDEGYWSQLESYITEHSEARFSHGICEECLAKHYPDERW